MTKDTVYMLDRLHSAGVSTHDALALRRISMTLHRWHELECGDSNDYNSFSIERDETSGKPFMRVYPHLEGKTRRYSVPDRETGAKKRLDAIMARYPNLRAYVQSDPRGAALYVLSNEMIPACPKLGIDQWIDANYSRGIAIHA